MSPRPHRVRRAQFWLAGDDDLEAVNRALERVRDQQQEKKCSLLPPPEPVFPHPPPQTASQGWWRVCGLLLLSTAAAATVVFNPGLPYLSFDQGFSLDSWAAAETKVAWKHILANVGPAAGAEDGVVIASPSTGSNHEPDYFYTWTRDAALTVSSLLPEFLPPSYLRPWEPSNATAHTASNPLLEGLVRSYITSQARIQATPNPSGDLWSGGLSEPKFTAQGRPFTRSWGRPQRDGPALRALALIPYAHWLLDRAHPSDLEYVRKCLYNPHALRTPGSVIKNDLEEVAQQWAQPGFDLWEEVNGRHLWTDAVSRRALQAGAILAARVGDPLAARFYDAEAQLISEHLTSYKNHTWRATEDTPNNRTGLDASILLSVIHTGSVDDNLSPTNPDVLDSLAAYIESFTYLYEVNNASSWKDGWLVGRYAEDVYDGVGFTGGNPWYITTLAVANVLYAAKAGFTRAGTINPTHHFWGSILNLTTMHDGVWSANMPEFQFALAALQSTGDNFLARVAEHTHRGRMSEQISRDNGVPTGARDLTWSYAAFLTANRARNALKH